MAGGESSRPPRRAPARRRAREAGSVVVRRAVDHRAAGAGHPDAVGVQFHPEPQIKAFRAIRSSLPSSRRRSRRTGGGFMVELNHTIVWCKDQKRSSAFLAEMLGLPAPTRFGHFDVITLANGISMDFVNRPGAFTPAHYAFLITEAEFDAVLERIKEQG